jgi:hypothetical protein
MTYYAEQSCTAGRTAFITGGLTDILYQVE